MGSVEKRKDYLKRNFLQRVGSKNLHRISKGGDGVSIYRKLFSSHK